MKAKENKEIVETRDRLETVMGSTLCSSSKRHISCAIRSVDWFKGNA